MRVAAESPDAYFFAFKIFRPLDVRLAHNTVSQKVFYAADKNLVGKAVNDGAYVADCAGDADLGITVQGRCGGHRG